MLYIAERYERKLKTHPFERCRPK